MENLWFGDEKVVKYMVTESILSWEEKNTEGTLEERKLFCGVS